MCTTQWFDIHIPCEVITAVSSSHLSLYKVIIILTIFPMLYITSLWLIYFITESRYFLIPFTLFTIPPPATSLWQPSVCSLYLWVCFCFVFLDSMSQIIRYLSLSFWLFSLSIIPSRSIHGATNGKISLLYGWVILHCVCVCINTTSSFIHPSKT